MNTYYADLHVHTAASLDGRSSLEDLTAAAAAAGLHAMAVTDHDQCTPEAAVAAIREAGGLAVLAHPFHRPGRQGADYAFPLDAVEAVNARACFKNPAANDQAAAFAARRQLPSVGGSDAHDAKEVGNARTALTAEALTLPALREALAAGRSQALLQKNTPHIRKGLSQWTKARRQGGVYRICRAAAYVGYCAILDISRR